MPGLRIHLYENRQQVESVECPGAVELGRQTDGAEALNAAHQVGTRWRVAVARRDEVSVPRHWLLAEPLAAGVARLTNLNPTLPITFWDRSELQPGASREVALPVFLMLGDRPIGLQAADVPAVALPERDTSSSQPAKIDQPLRSPGLRLLEGDQGTALHTLAAATIPPGFRLTSSRADLMPKIPSGGPHNETMIAWLRAAMDVLQSAAGSAEFFDKAAAALVDLVGLDSGQVLLFQDGAWRSQAQKVAATHRQGDERHASRSVLARVLSEKRTFWQVPATQAPQGSLVGINAVVAAPILGRDGAVLGALYGDRQAVGASAGQQPITQMEALLVELLAGGVAAGVARIEQEQAELEQQEKFVLYERELQIGRTIQNGFLPETLPLFPGWEIVGHFQPAREVAGDFYDCFPLSGNHVALVMADVCDKGVGAALFMALFRTLIRAFCIQTPFTVLMSVSSEEFHLRGKSGILPANQRRASLVGDLITLLTVEHVNRYVTSNHASAVMFATLFLGVLDLNTGELTYVNAGHDSPTILGAHGIKARLEQTGPVVGVIPDASFNLNKTRLEPGDILLAHTDGVPDARNPSGKAYTESRFLALLAGGSSTAGALVERLVTDLRSHIGDADQFDDITLLAIRRNPDTASATPPA
jgi:sigma-B regulation protein RsbU (phosphoserine phosphatase)